jgi:hypothetical protein
VRIIDKDNKITIPRDSYYAEAIRSIVKAFERQKADNDSIPERNDIKALWPQLQYDKKWFLHAIAQHQGTIGVSQLTLEEILEVNWEKLRGIHNGLARISARLEMENPVRTIGYNRSNRRYHVDASTAKTVLSYWENEQQ